MCITRALKWHDLAGEARTHGAVLAGPDIAYTTCGASHCHRTLQSLASSEGDEGAGKLCLNLHLAN